MSTVLITQEKAAEIARSGSMVVSIADSYEIVDAEMDALLVEDMLAWKKTRDTIEENRLEIGRASRALLEVATKHHVASIAELDRALAIGKQKHLTYTTEQKRIADEARRAAEAEQRAERERLEAERAAAEKAVAEAHGSGDAAAIAQAEQLVDDANFNAEVQMLEAAHPVVMSAPKVKGASTRENWKAEVVDADKYILAAMERPELRPGVVLDQTYLNQLARAMKAKACIPGVRVYADQSLALRSK